MKRHKYKRRRKSAFTVASEKRAFDDSLCCRNTAKNIISKAKSKSHKASLIHYKDNEAHKGGAVIYSGCSAFKGYTRARSWVRKDS